MYGVVLLGDSQRVDVTGSYRVIGDVSPTLVDVPSLVVDSKTGGLANVIVYLKTSPDGPHKPTRPAPEVVVREGSYVPRILTVMAGETATIKSDDGTLFSPRISLINNNPNCYATTPGPNGEVPVPLEKPEPLPMPVRCDINPNLAGYWLVVDHPYAAVTDLTGSFTIKDLPAGEHELIIWHEEIGYIERTRNVVVPDSGNVVLPPAFVPGERFASTESQ